MTTTFEPVRDADREALVDFMFAHAPIMMFPLTNLARFGMGGDHPRAISAWVVKSDDGITDVLTLSQEGMIFPCCPSAPWTAAAHLMKGRQVKGLIGEGTQIAALRQVCGLTTKAHMDEVEPSFVLSLADLRSPNTDGFELRPYYDAPRDLLAQWRAAYEVETLSVAPKDALKRAEHHVEASILKDSHRVLLKDKRPVAVTGFNASLPEIVQIGGVYTPPGLRGNGYAKVAVAMHLMEAAVEGVTEAVLSAANPSAEKVYTALGFERSGDFALVIYDALQTANG